MSRDGLLPEGEALRKAVRWIGERGDHSRAAVEAACVHFDLSPRDAAFLLDHFVGTGNASASAGRRSGKAPPGDA